MFQARTTTTLDDAPERRRGMSTVESNQLSLWSVETGGILRPGPTAPLVDQGSPEAAFARAYRRMGLKRAAPEFHVEFRPFAGVRTSIRFRDGLADVRISDLFAEAPALVFEALAEILLAQVFWRKPSQEAKECYLAYLFRPAVRQRIEEARRKRGFKRLRPARGRHFDLDTIFLELNERLFAGRLETPSLGWSHRRSVTMLGHYDSAHRSITISRWLDSPDVPRCLVEYVLYHEMLHMRFAVRRQGHRRVVHSREFRRAEKEFPEYEQARKSLKLITAKELG